MKDLENTMFEKSLDEILCEKNFQIALNLFKKNRSWHRQDGF